MKFAPNNLNLPVVFLIATALAACSTMGISDVPLGAACPIPKVYSKAEQKMVAVELEAMPKGAVIPKWLADYHVERQQLKAARGLE